MLKRFAAFLIILASLQFEAESAHAGILKTGARIYSSVQIARIGILTARYIKQINSVSKLALNPKQLNLLKDCFRSRDCVNFMSNRNWDKTIKDNVVKEWERQTGKVWPSYSNRVASQKGGTLAEKGGMYDAHHIIPKSIGGPNTWWNIHPVPRPDHQSVIHASESFVNSLIQIVR